MTKEIEKTLEKMELTDLIAAQNAVADLIKQKHKEQKSKLFEQFQSIAKEYNLVLTDVSWGDDDGRKKRATVKVGKKRYVPKYVNPNDEAQTWTGLGRQPAWVREQLAQGKSLDDLRIASEAA